MTKSRSSFVGAAWPVESIATELCKAQKHFQMSPFGGFNRLNKWKALVKSKVKKDKENIMDYKKPSTQPSSSKCPRTVEYQICRRTR